MAVDITPQFFYLIGSEFVAEHSPLGLSDG
jgi:hypothetical protein